MPLNWLMERLGSFSPDGPEDSAPGEKSFRRPISKTIHYLMEKNLTGLVIIYAVAATTFVFFCICSRLSHPYAIVAWPFAALCVGSLVAVIWFGYQRAKLEQDCPPSKESGQNR